MKDIDNLTQQIMTEFSADSLNPMDSYIPQELVADEGLQGMKYVSLFNQDKVASSAVGLDYRSVAQELLKPLHRAMMKAGISSIAEHTLGDFLNAFPLDPGWSREELIETGKYFYVLKNQSREAQIYGIVRQACESTADDVITIPAVLPTVLTIDEPGVKLELKTHALTFTRKELKYIRFAFIKEMRFYYNDESNDPYLESCYVITIDRSKLGEAPYVNEE